MKLLKILAPGFVLLGACHAHADFSVNLSLVSDYSKRGITQTDNAPAAQFGIDYSTESDIYIGLWSSNVEFPLDATKVDETVDREIDAYIGSYYEISETSRFDTGISYYTYQGQDLAEEVSYGEGHALFDFALGNGIAEINAYYSWDYLGLDVGQQVIELGYAGYIMHDHRIGVKAGRIQSGDERRLNYEGESEYMHYQIAYSSSYKYFTFEIKGETTSLKDDRAKEKVIAGLSFSY